MSSAPNQVQDQRQAPGQHEAPDPGQPARWSIEPAGTGTMEHRAGAETGSAGVAGRRWRWLAFAAVITAAVMDLLDVFLQNGLGFTPWHSAVTTAPWAAGAFIGSAVGGITMSKLGRRVLHAGLVVEAAGLLAIYAVLRGAGGGVSTVDLLAPMVAGGIGMGMVFVPLFDIVMAGVRPQEMGSASGVLQTVNALGMSLGIAGIGAIFFALVSGRGGHVPVYLHAAQWTALATVGLLACSFVVAFGLPRRAREMGAPVGPQ